MATVPLNKFMAIWAITPNGVDLGTKIRSGFTGADLYVSENIGKDKEPENEFFFTDLARELKKKFFFYRHHVFLFSTGIAVRLLAPLVQSKLDDPAVVVIDDRAVHVISLLSGHLGGANELARRLAALVNGTPVITTATDVNALPAIDMIAKKCGLFIETPEQIKKINMAFLTDKKIVLTDPGSFVRGSIPEKFISRDASDRTRPEILCSWRTQKVSRETMVLRPRVLSVGIGCNKHTPFEVIYDFYMKTMTEENLSVKSLVSIATTDVKKEEKGLILLSKTLGVPLLFYGRDELNAVKTIENPSKMVEKHLGVKSVCEAAAILAANNGKLIVPKKKNPDVTLAVALKR